jgi:dTDP-4-dehydrorhamnose reductase
LSRSSIPLDRVSSAMRVAIIGAAGLFGCGLVQIFRERHETFLLTRKDADITDAAGVGSQLARIKPDVVVHPAGIPDLDICEDDPAKASLVNVEGTRNIVEAAREVGASVAYISSDAVFDGKKTEPYTEIDATHPPTVYGRSKLSGEQVVKTLPAHWIFRVSVLFGPGKINFVERGLLKLAAGETYAVAVDQIGSATYTVDAAAKIMEVVEARKFGLYHLSNEGACSRYELAVKAAEIAGLDPKGIIAKPDAEMGRRTPRLKYAVMAMDGLKQAGFAPPRHWEEALMDYVRGLKA